MLVGPLNHVKEKDTNMQKNKSRQLVLSQETLRILTGTGTFDNLQITTDSWTITPGCGTNPPPGGTLPTNGGGGSFLCF
jgi:hypothetical protein